MIADNRTARSDDALRAAGQRWSGHLCGQRGSHTASDWAASILLSHTPYARVCVCVCARARVRLARLAKSSGAPPTSASFKQCTRTRSHLLSITSARWCEVREPHSLSEGADNAWETRGQLRAKVHGIAMGWPGQLPPHWRWAWSDKSYVKQLRRGSHPPTVLMDARECRAAENVCARGVGETHSRLACVKNCVAYGPVIHTQATPQQTHPDVKPDDRHVALVSGT
jgi:hypothetical protein